MAYISNNILNEFVNNGGLTILVLLLILFVPIWFIVLIIGVNLCKNNNALGVVLLCIALAIIPGLILGCALLYNSKNNPIAIAKREARLKRKLQELERNSTLINSSKNTTTQENPN